MRHVLFIVFLGLVPAVVGALLIRHFWMIPTAARPAIIAGQERFRSHHSSSAAFDRASNAGTSGSSSNRASHNSDKALPDAPDMAESMGPPAHRQGDVRWPEASVPAHASNSANSSGRAPSEPSATAIQLESDVRLPAALLPPYLVNQPIPVDAAVQEITNAFYRRLQAVADADGNSKEIRGSEDTIMISQNPSTAHARDLANEQYRALFGNEAYNQKTLESTIEAQLPPN